MFARPRRAALAALALVLALGVFFRFFRLGDRLVWHDELATRVFAAGYTVDDWKKELYTGAIFDVAEVQKFQHHNPDRGSGGAGAPPNGGPAGARMGDPGPNRLLAAIRGMADDDPQHPPLYYALTRVWVGLFGDSVAALRSLSVLAALAALPLAFWLALELFGSGSARVAWTAVALFALSPFFVLYAQEAREYALWTALILLSNASLLRAVRFTEAQDVSRGRRARAWALYSVATVLSLYTSFTTASLIAAQIAWLVLRERFRAWTPVAISSFCALAAAAAVFVPWVRILLKHWDAFQISMRWSRIIVIPRVALLRILGQNASRTIVDLGHEVVSPLDHVVMFLAVAVILLALVELVRRAPRASAGLLLLEIALPIGMLIVPDLVSGGIRSVSMRYTTPSWAAVILAVAFLLASALEEEAPVWRRALAAVVFLAAAGSCVGNAGRDAPWTKATSVDLPKVAAAINAAPDPLLVGNLERENPGNLMALSILLKPGTHMQFLDSRMEEHWVLPRRFGSVFLMSPIPEYKQAMEGREHVTTRLVLRDTFLDLWKIEASSQAKAEPTPSPGER